MTLDELQKLCDEATIGPWTNRMQDGVCNKYIDEGIVIAKEERDNMRPEDIALIVAARTYLPKLIAVARAAKELRDESPWFYGDLKKALAALEEP